MAGEPKPKPPTTIRLNVTLERRDYAISPVHDTADGHPWNWVVYRKGKPIAWFLVRSNAAMFIDALEIEGR